MRTRRDPTVMNGAVMKNFATPNAPFASALVGGGDAFVSEVDESDGSIALFAPRVAVLNNVSLDHKSLEELNQLFGDFIAKAEIAVVNLDNPDGAALAGTLPQAPGHRLRAGGRRRCSIARDIERRAVRREVHAGHARPRSAPGRAAGAGPPQHLQRARRDRRGARAGVALDEAAIAIGGFTGLRRRFDLVGETRGVAVLDDFGHNPDKIAATLDTLHAFPRAAARCCSSRTATARSR